ncbi:MAG: lamin tail domain-containing protein, partial [Chloroflexi bacterium]|nr:lamin tail domain-containing protein [Chloroflexota bacterium]
GQYYLITKKDSYMGSVSPDREYTVAGIADDGGLALRDGIIPTSVIIDQVGLCTTTLYKEGSTLSSMSGTSNQSYERKDGGSAGSCKDTDNNSTDFIFNSSTSYPQNSASTAVPCLAIVDVTSSSSGVYPDTSSAVIDIQLEFSNIVTVTGTPTLLMEVGTTDRNAVYTGGSGTNVLTFNYTIQSGDNTNDLDYVSYNALSLNGGSIIGASGNATLILPRPGSPGSLSANEDIAIDNTSVTPTLLSFTRQDPTSQYTNADELVFRVTFSEAVKDVGIADFVSSGYGLVDVVKVENGRMYDVTVSDGSYEGTVSISLSSLPPYSISDVYGNQLTFTLPPATNQIYEVDKTAPTVTIVQAVGQIENPTTLPINFTVTFDEEIDVNTFTTVDIRQNGTATGITWMITDSGDHKTFTLSAIASSNGTINPSIDADRVNDPAGNYNSSSGNPGCASPEPNNCVTYTDSVSPTVTINQSGTQLDPTSALPINFTVQFSEPINTAVFTTSDITQSGTAANVVWSITNSGDNKTFTLSATSSGYGTIIPSIAANRVTDLSGNNNTASTSTDNSVTFAASSVRSIIINEVAWAGTTSSLTDDEWIELYNSTNASVNITGWTLKAADGTPTITLNGTIPAGEYFLLERDNDTTVSDITADQIYTGDLSNSGEALSLLDGANKVIDTANGNGGSWPAGSSSTYGTMERTSTSADSDSIWRTNTGAVKNGKNANGGDILGTPKKSNSPLPTPTPTPDKTSTPTPLPPTAAVDPRPIINEILARPGFDWNQDGKTDVFDEFIEIKNLTSIEISLSGWKLSTVDGSSFSLPDVKLKPGDRVVFYGEETKILLSDGGETLRLSNASGKIYDAFTYELARTEDKSFCRLPDGNPGNSWFEDCIPTPNLTNTREGKSPTSADG